MRYEDKASPSEKNDKTLQMQKHFADRIMNDRAELTDRKQHFPELADLPRPGRSLLALCVHDQDCGACKTEIQQIAEAADGIEAWGCDVALILPASDNAPANLPARWRHLHDSDGKFAGSAGVECPGVVLVDEWRDVSFKHSAGPRHEFPGVARLISEIRYLGTRCPECEGEAL